MLPEFCLTEDGEKLVLSRFHGEIPVKGGKEETKKIAYVDLETTGLNPARDEIIEIGILKFDLGLQSGKIVRVDGEYQSLQDPKIPLPAVITRITGLTDADLADQAIAWPEVEAIFQDCDLIVAHNAQFDRGFLERKLPGLKDKIFACSVSQVPWTEHHYGCRKLEHLCWEHGFFFLAHRFGTAG